MQSNAFDINELLNAKNTNFQMAPKILYSDSSELEESKIQQYTLTRGIPLVLSNTLDGWDRDLFTLDYLQEQHSHIDLAHSLRDSETHRELKGWTVGKFCEYLKVSPEERNPKYLYAKDVQCPAPWRDYLARKLSRNLVHQDPGYDMMSSLPEYLRTDSLKVFIGPGGTYTPGHLNNLGTNGHNIMVSAQDADFSYAYWFFIGRHNLAAAMRFWASKGGDLFSESRFINPRELLYAPFKVYIVRQQVGDLVLIPPESVHQVVNIGAPSIKIAWSTMSANTLPSSYYSALPQQRVHFKPETYRIKAIIYYALKKRMAALQSSNFIGTDLPATIESISPLLEMFHHIVQTESILIPKPSYPFAAPDETIPFLKPFKLFNSQHVHDRRCSRCACDIFNRCYHCPICSEEGDANGEGNGHDYCFDCVSQGHGCADHFQDMALKEYISHTKIKKELDYFYEIYAELLVRNGSKQKDAEEMVHARQDKIFEQCGFLTTATLAYHVIYFSTQKEVRCHQCDKHYKKHSIVFCCNCPARYCRNCCQSYDVSFYNLISHSTWKCFSCTGTCSCYNCTNQSQPLNNNNNINTISSSSNKYTLSEDSKHLSAIKLLSEQCMMTEPIPISNSSPPLTSSSGKYSGSGNGSGSNSPPSSSSSSSKSTLMSIPSISNLTSKSITSNSRTTQPMLITNLTTNSPQILGKTGGLINNSNNINNNNNNNINTNNNAIDNGSKHLDDVKLESKKRPIQYNEKPKGRPPKNLKEWTNSHKFILGLIEIYRNNSKYTSIKSHGSEPTPELVQLYLENRECFGGLLWAKTINFPLLPCLWVRDLTIIPPSTKLLPSLRVGKKIVVLFFGNQEEDYVGIVGKKSLFAFDEVNQTLLLKCSVEPLRQLELLFNITEPQIANKKEIQEFDYKSQIDETEEGLVVKASLYKQQQQQQQQQVVHQSHSHSPHSHLQHSHSPHSDGIQQTSPKMTASLLLSSALGSSGTSIVSNSNGNKSGIILPSLFPSASTQSSTSTSPPHHTQSTKSASSKPSSTSKSMTRFTSLGNEDQITTDNNFYFIDNNNSNDNDDNNINNNNSNSNNNTTLNHIIEKAPTRPIIMRK